MRPLSVDELGQLMSDSQLLNTDMFMMTQMFHFHRAYHLSVDGTREQFQPLAELYRNAPDTDDATSSGTHSSMPDLVSDSGIDSDLIAFGIVPYDDSDSDCSTDVPPIDSEALCTDDESAAVDR